ncbi:MAG TPA: hypothetical protein PKY96_12080, partial [Flavobacteriales bacterium]|nr:hypothetical protein [Flavobacteriales bacterium]
IDATGNYTYILYVPAPCENDTAQVVMDVVAPVSAGTDGSATLCSNALPLALMSALGGAPDAGGSWTGPLGATEGSFDPQTDAPGSYT